MIPPSSLKKKINFIFIRSRCLTKNYCSKECFAADEAVHAVCCKNKQDVDKRKVKIGGKAKAEMVNQNLKAHQVSIQQHPQFQNDKYEVAHRLVTETLSKIKGLKVKEGQQKEEKDPKPVTTETSDEAISLTCVEEKNSFRPERGEEDVNSHNNRRQHWEQS